VLISTGRGSSRGPLAGVPPEWHSHGFKSSSRSSTRLGSTVGSWVTAAPAPACPLGTVDETTKRTWTTPRRRGHRNEAWLTGGAPVREPCGCTRGCTPLQCQRPDDPLGWNVPIQPSALERNSTSWSPLPRRPASCTRWLLIWGVSPSAAAAHASGGSQPWTYVMNVVLERKTCIPTSYRCIHHEFWWLYKRFSRGEADWYRFASPAADPEGWAEAASARTRRPIPVRVQFSHPALPVAHTLRALPTAVPLKLRWPLPTVGVGPISGTVVEGVASGDEQG